jgi:hypothetical protein
LQYEVRYRRRRSQFFLCLLHYFYMHKTVREKYLTMQKSIETGRLKGFIISCLFVFAVSGGFSQPPDTKLLVAIDGFAPAVKVGIKKDLSERFSIQGSAGCFILGPSLLSWNVFGSYKLTNPEKSLSLSLNFGLLDNYIVLSEPMISLGFGGGAGLSYRFKNNSALTLRLGAITGPSLDQGEYRTLSLPNYGIEYAFHLRSKR